MYGTAIGACERCGTSGYVAPEILKAKKQEGYGINVDVFSVSDHTAYCIVGELTEYCSVSCSKWPFEPTRRFYCSFVLPNVG